MPSRRLGFVAASLLLGSACGGSTPNAEERDAIESVPVDASWELPNLSRRAHVVYTEGHVPHVYAANERDAARVSGFLHARSRFTQLELTRRYGQGLLTPLIGDAALGADQQSRGRGANEITDRLLERLTAEDAAVIDAYAEGINAYIAMSKESASEELGVPTELRLIALVLGGKKWPTLLAPYTRRDVVSILTAVLFNSSFTSDDLARQRVSDALPDMVTGAPQEALREAGAREDLLEWVEPVHEVASSDGFGLQMARLEKELVREPGVNMPREVLARALHSSERFDRMRRGAPGSDYGSNAWALGAQGTRDGHTLLAGDGHLPLSVPTLLFQMGVDTSIYGKDKPGSSLLGLFFPGVPRMPIGTNGHVAFSFTYLYGDLVDWYGEQIILDADGAPSSSLFRGEAKPLASFDEVYEIANVPALSSVGRTETWRRWKTFDGRFLVSIEGDVVAPDATAGVGQTIVSMSGERILVRDVNGDGIVSGISFDYTGFDVSNLVGALRLADRATSVEEFRDAQRSFVGFAQNFVASDTSGSVYYSGYTGTPCRSHLPRIGTGAQTRFAAGADPRMLLDGTRYGAFEIPLSADDRVDESFAADEFRCAIPFDRWPQAIDPAAGFTLTANNDIGGISFDGSLANDEYYLGGPWAPGYRAKTIHDSLASAVSSSNGTVESMQALQADHSSRVAPELIPYLVQAVGEAEALDTPTTPEEIRLRALYTNNQAPIVQAMERLSTWLGRGAVAESGVTTFYDSPDDDARADAAATMIWNAFYRKLNANVFDDEGLDALLELDPRFMRITSLQRFLRGRGAGNTEQLASFDPATNESVFFDDRSTAEVESSREILLASIVDALTELTSAPSAPAQGGFGTSDQSAWLWGMRHQVVFESLVTGYAGDVSGIELLTSAMEITTKTLPLMPNLAADDARSALRWFPRPGDFFAVDAANPPMSGPDYSYRNGPVMRMVVELGPEGFVRGENIVPAGQSGISGNPFFADQAALWLGNRALPMRYYALDVAEHATGHEVFE